MPARLCQYPLGLHNPKLHNTTLHNWALPLLQVDVEETRNSYRWYADVPGLTKDNIQVSWPASCSFQS